MKKTYLIEITSTDPERNNFLKEKRINIMNERFYCLDKANGFCKRLNETEAFRFYKETARVIREI